MDCSKPLTKTDLKRMIRTPRAKIIRKAFGLTQAEFSKAFGIPIGTLRDWEQNKSKPDKTARMYLLLIAKAPLMFVYILETSDRKNI